MLRARARALGCVVGTLLLAIIAPQVVHAGSVRIAPVVVNVAPDSAYGSLWLSNPDDTPWRAEVRVYKWEQRDGHEVLMPTDELGASPRLLDVPGGGRQLVRLVPLAGGPGRTERAFRVVIEEQVVPGRPATPLLRYSAAVFLQPEQRLPPNPGLTTRIVSGERGPAVRVENAGPQHARLGDLTYLDAAGNREMVVADLAGYVLPGQAQQWDLPQPAQHYAGGGFAAVVNAGTEPLALAPAGGTASVGQ